MLCPGEFVPHTGAVACLADLILWTLGKKKALKGADKIQEEFLTQLGEKIEKG